MTVSMETDSLPVRAAKQEVIRQGEQVEKVLSTKRIAHESYPDCWFVAVRIKNKGSHPAGPAGIVVGVFIDGHGQVIRYTGVQ